MSGAVPTTSSEAKRLKALWNAIDDADPCTAVFQLRAAMAVAVTYVPPDVRGQMFDAIEDKARAGELS